MTAFNYFSNVAKLFSVVLLCMAFTAAQAQTDKIKVRKPANCTYQVIMNSRMNNKIMAVNGIECAGFGNESCSRVFRQKIDLIIADKILIDKKNLETRFANVCRIENYILKTVTINRVYSLNDIDPGFIIAFEYTELKQADR
ncbi:MAG: hypothetical protein ACXVPQ_00985 [Bacteroidia bacterium]